MTLFFSPKKKKRDITIGRGDGRDRLLNSPQASPCWRRCLRLLSGDAEQQQEQRWNRLRRGAHPRRRTARSRRHGASRRRRSILFPPPPTVGWTPRLLFLRRTSREERRRAAAQSGPRAFGPVSRGLRLRRPRGSASEAADGPRQRDDQRCPLHLRVASAAHERARHSSQSRAAADSQGSQRRRQQAAGEGTTTRDETGGKPTRNGPAAEAGD